MKFPSPQFKIHYDTLRAYGGLHCEHVNESEHFKHGHVQATHEGTVLLVI